MLDCLILHLKYFEKAETRAMWASVINKGLLLVSVLVALFVMKTLFKRTDGSPAPFMSLLEPTEEESGIPEIPEGSGVDKQLGDGLDDSVDKEEEKVEKLESYMKKNKIKPTDALRGWFSNYLNDSDQKDLEEEIDEDIFIKKLSPEARARLKAKDKMTTAVIDYAKEKPSNASKLIHTWITK